MAGARRTLSSQQNINQLTEEVVMVRNVVISTKYQRTDGKSGVHTTLKESADNKDRVDADNCIPAMCKETEEVASNDDGVREDSFYTLLSRTNTNDPSV